MGWQLRAVFFLRQHLKAVKYHTLLEWFCFKATNATAVRHAFRCEQGSMQSWAEVPVLLVLLISQWCIYALVQPKCIGATLNNQKTVVFLLLKCQNHLALAGDWSMHSSKLVCSNYLLGRVASSSLRAKDSWCSRP